MRLAATVGWSKDGTKYVTAASRNRVDVVRYLQEKGAPWSNDDYEMALESAVKFGSIDCLDFLLDDDHRLTEMTKKYIYIESNIMTDLGDTDSVHDSSDDEYMSFYDTDDDDYDDDDRRFSLLNMNSQSRIAEAINQHGYDEAHDDLCDMAARIGHPVCLRLLHSKGGLPLSRRILAISSHAECLAYVLDVSDSSDHEASVPFAWEGQAGRLFIRHLYDVHLGRGAVNVVSLLLSRRALSSVCHVMMARDMHGIGLRAACLRRIEEKIKDRVASELYGIHGGKRRRRSEDEFDAAFKACESAALSEALVTVEPIMRAVRPIQRAWLEYSYAAVAGRPGYERGKTDSLRLFSTRSE